MKLSKKSVIIPKPPKGKFHPLTPPMGGLKLTSCEKSPPDGGFRGWIYWGFRGRG